MNDNWESHYQQKITQKLTPAFTLSKALQLFEKENIYEGLAIDLGSGSGIDTLELLNKNWNVIAVDQNPFPGEILDNVRQSGKEELLTTIQQSFENIQLPPSLLINATFSLPFCSPVAFPELWAKITKSIKTGGRFAGQLFGNNDSWTARENMTFHQREELESLFCQFDLEIFEEIEKDGKTISGQPKHWHVFHIVAKKKSIF